MIGIAYRLGVGLLAGLLASQWLSVWRSYLVGMLAWTIILALAWPENERDA